MSDKRLTPPLYLKGAFVLLSPFNTDLRASTAYQCMAIRSFSDLYQKENVQAFETFYVPKGIDEATYNADAALGAAIITLMSDTGHLVYVPDTYIESMPEINIVPYNHVVASISLGILPDGLDLAFLEDLIKGAIDEGLGIENPIVNFHIVPSESAITPQQHADNESARNARIVNRDTDRAKVVSLTQTVSDQNVLIQGLETIINDAGLIP